MRNVRGISIFVACTLILLCALSSSAQKISGDISGDVTDKSGGVIAGATVTVENTGTGFTRTTTTNASGNFRIPELPIGTYRVSVSSQGFKTTVSNVVVSAAAVTEATYALEVGQRAETVMVEGSAPLVELSSNNNNYVDAEKIVEVPLNGRDFNSLLAITPGVQRAPGGGFLAVSINGSRTTSNNYLIDGLYNNDRYYGDSAINQTGVVGIPATLFPPEAIQELGIQETPSAEFGVKGGAPINLVMKSGSNAWHGDARWVRHTDAFDAANFFADGTGPTPLRNMQFGGTLGGPIIKDKTFFFVYYEGQRYASFATKRFDVPNAGGYRRRPHCHRRRRPDHQSDRRSSARLSSRPAPVPLLATTLLPFNTPTTATMDTFGFKIDQKITNNIQLSGRYIFGDSLAVCAVWCRSRRWPGRSFQLRRSQPRTNGWP